MNINLWAAVEAFAQRVYREPGTNAPLSLDKIQLKPYAYTLTFAALAQGAVATQALNIQANSDFILTGMSIRANIGTIQTVNNASLPFVRLLITDSGTNEQFTSAPVDVVAYTAVQATSSDGVFPYPRLLTGRTSLSIQATNYAPAAETYSFDILFEGALARIYG